MTARVAELSPARLATILGVTFVLLAGGLWFTLVSPKESKAHSLSVSIKSAQTQLDQLTRDEPAARKHAVSQSLLMLRAMPNTVAMPQIVLQLSRIATEEHVSLDSIIPVAPVSYSGYEAQPITITLGGTFFEVEGFLEQLRNQVRAANDGVTATGRLYDVLNVTIQATQPAPKVTATVTLDAFAYTAVGVSPAATAGPSGSASTSG